MNKRVFALLFCLLLLLPVLAGHAVTYPAYQGPVNDDAAVLSPGTASDIVTLNQRSTAQFTVVTRHFLGGADAQQYCDALFSAWNLGKNDLLLLLVIGEERYAVTAGETIRNKALSGEKINGLLSDKLREYFIKDRNYDHAVGAFLLAAAEQTASANGNSLKTSDLFTSLHSAGASAYQSSAGSGLNQYYSNNDLNQTSHGSASYDYESGSGFSVWRVILIIGLLSVILRNRHRRAGGAGGRGGPPHRR